MRYNIGIYGSSGAASRYSNVDVANPHAECFADFARALAAALRNLGHEVSNDVTGPGRLIAFGINNSSIDAAADAVPADAIVFNTEQVAVDGDARQITNYRYYQERGNVVWDYSQANIRTLSAMGLRAVHCPVGYADRPAGDGRPAMSRIVPLAPEAEDIDVLFYGSLSPRRIEVLDALDRTGLKVHRIVGGWKQENGRTVLADLGLYGEARDAMIARAKVVINLRYYEGGVFEVFRCSHLWANRKAVVTEAGGVDAGLEALAARCCEYVPRHDVVDACRRLVADLEARRALAQRGFEEFKKIDLADSVRRALEQS